MSLTKKLQKAEIRNPHFEPLFYSDGERAVGMLVSHSGADGRRLILGREVWTSRVTKKFKNGNFLTLNTHYKVVK